MINPVASSLTDTCPAQPKHAKGAYHPQCVGFGGGEEWGGVLGGGGGALQADGEGEGMDSGLPPYYPAPGCHKAIVSGVQPCTGICQKRLNGSREWFSTCI